MSPELGLFIPAAGASARMRGRDKLIEPINGVPLLRRQAQMAVATTLPVLVTLRTDRPARHAALADIPGLDLQDITDPDQGMSASMRAAAKWAIARNLSGLMVILGDMPDLQTADLIALTESFSQNPNDILRATDQSGQPGHPVILPARLFNQLTRLTGDDGGRSVIAGQPVRLFPLPEFCATTDLDTPEDWANWRQANP